MDTSLILGSKTGFTDDAGYCISIYFKSDDHDLIAVTLNAPRVNDNYYNVDGTNLYISSGIGVSTVNYRLFNHPSINFYRINKDN